MITLIAAIGRNNEIGYQNQLLWNIPEDMKHFKAYTMGKTIVMGAKTFASIGRVLPGRKCIVISTAGIGGLALRASSIESALSVEHCYDELVIIGGASIYKQFIDYADKLVITHVDAECVADTFFPAIDSRQWLINNTIAGSNVTHQFKFVEYVRDESNGITKRKTS